jgi:tRNA (Thr-GGU) A37 N-methylase
MLEGLRSLLPGDEVILITWLDRARRDLVAITAIDGRRIRVRNLEALDGTPVIDVKPILNEDVGLR